MNHLLQDLRVGWRSLWRTPGFTLVVILVMALGIGANTMIFGIANTFLFREVPYIDMKRNVRVQLTEPRRNVDDLELSYPEFQDVRAHSRTLEKVGGYYETQAYITMGREPERFQATAITGGFLQVFGTRPEIGREFLRSEEEKDRSYTVILLSDRIWRERLGADPQVLGRTLKMNGRVRTIVGVAPPEFRFPEIADFFIPIPHDPVEDKRDTRYLAAVGRLKPGASIAQASAEFAALVGDLARRYPDSNRGMGGRVISFREDMTDDMLPILMLLMSAVAFVLLIACANVANLLLARGAGRQREIALRYALGATRWRVVLQLLMESLIVSALGGLLGFLLAIWGRDLVLATIPLELPFWMKFGTHPNTVLFLAGVSLVATVLAGLAPALQTSQVNVHGALKEGGQHGTAGRRRSRLRNGLVVAEISLALVLLAGAGLMIRSFLRMTEQRATLRPEGVLTARLTMPVAVYPEEADRRRFMDGLMPAVQALPGVQSASTTNVLPLTRGNWSRGVLKEDEPEGPDAPWHDMLFATVRPDYFRTLGIPLRSGRDFTPQDGPHSPPVAIVSETAARQLWPGQDPLGHRLKFGRDSLGLRTVVGLVADVRQNVENKRPPAGVYIPHAQEPQQSVTLVVLHTGDPAAMTAALRRLVQSRDADMPLYEVRTMNESLRFGLWEQRIYVSLMGVFALVALIIAAVGIYGVMAYSVAQRTQEIGIRMALGAARGDVLRLVVGQALRLTALGVGIGLAGAYAVTRLMASLLFGVSASDPPTFVGVTVILAASALVAAWVPSARATRVDPMVALRAE